MPLYFAVLFLILAVMPGPAHADTGSVPRYDTRAFCGEFLKLPESQKPENAPKTMGRCLESEGIILDYLKDLTILPSLLEICVGHRSQFNGYGGYDMLRGCLTEEAYILPEVSDQWTYLPRYDIKAMCAQRVRLSRKRGKPLRIEKCITLEEAAADAISRRRIAFHLLVDCEKISRYALSPEYTDGSYIALVGCIREVGPSFKAAFPSYGFDKYCESKGASNPGSICRLQETDMWGKALDLVYTRPVSVEMLKACDARVRRKTSVGSYELFASCLRKEVDKARAPSLLGR